MLDYSQIDEIGRLSLAQMRTAVWENLAAIYPASVDSDSGEQSASYRIDPLYTKALIDRLLNEALTARMLDLVNNNELAFADEEVIDVKKDIVEYQLPTDCAFVRGMWWKNSDVTIMQVPRSERLFMYQVEEGDSSAFVSSIMTLGPSYRFIVGGFILNESPTVDNPGGILIEYIKWSQPLVNDEDTIETQYARLLQELIILDAAIAAASRRGDLDTQQLRLDQQKWEARLQIAGRMHIAPSVRWLMADRFPIKGRF